MKPYGVFIVLLIFVFTDSVVAETETRKYSQGSVVIEYSEFRESETTPSEIERLKKCGECNGIDGYLPHTITKGIWVKAGADILDIPILLIEDLYNLNIGLSRVVEYREGIEIQLKGGDGIASYRAVFNIDFRNMRVKRSLYRIPNMDIPIVLESEVRHRGKQP